MEERKYIKQNENLSNDGYRVIAIADGKVKGTNVKDIKKLNDPDYITKYVREKYLYSKDGEIILRIDE